MGATPKAKSKLRWAGLRNGPLRTQKQKGGINIISFPRRKARAVVKVKAGVMRSPPWHLQPRVCRMGQRTLLFCHMRGSSPCQNESFPTVCCCGAATQHIYPSAAARAASKCRWAKRPWGLSAKSSNGVMWELFRIGRDVGGKTLSSVSYGTSEANVIDRMLTLISLHALHDGFAQRQLSTAGSSLFNTQVFLE